MASWECSPITASLGYLHQLHQKATYPTMMMILLLDHKIHLDGLSTPLPLRIPIFLRDPGLPLLQPPAHQPSWPGLLPVAVLWVNQLSFWDPQAQRPLEVSSGSNGTSSFPSEQSTVPSPTIEVTVSTLSTNFHVSLASTVVVNSTGHSYLPQLSYGDVKKHLPSIGVPDFASVPNASSTSHGPLKVAQLMLGLPPTATGPLKMAPSSPMSISTSLVSKEKPLTTKSFTLGTNAFGSLGTPE